MDTKVYDDFEPFSKWLTEDTYDLLKVYLNGFQKEEIGIEINTKNEIIISGERPSEGSPNRMMRFHKEIRISPKEYEITEIEANFEGGCLSIVLPRKVRSNTMIFADQLISLKHLYRRPQIGKWSRTEKVLLAVSLGMVLGAFLAYKYSHYSSDPYSKK